MERRRQFHLVVPPWIFVTVLASVAGGQYSGGTGAPDDPYLIGSPQDLITLGQTPADYHKYFALTGDIDLSGITFDRAVIAPDTHSLRGEYQGTPFAGHFDGRGHVIRHLRIEGQDDLGLFGRTDDQAVITSLGMEMVDIRGGSAVGALVGFHNGNLSLSYSTGTIEGAGYHAGGLVGYDNRGTISSSYSRATVTGRYFVGGLVGYMREGRIAVAYSTGAVTGKWAVGGLVGDNLDGSVISSFWDIETSGQSHSAGGIGLTASEMMSPEILSLNGLAQDPNWTLDADQDYAHLAWEGAPGQVLPASVVDWMEGHGTPEAPYQIASVEQLVRLSKASVLADKHFVLTGDLDLAGIVWPRAVIPYFTGSFAGNKFRIHHFHIQGTERVGFFGHVTKNAVITSLGLEAVDVNGVGYRVGSLVGWNDGGDISASYSTGAVTGGSQVGGLVGDMERGNIALCHSSCRVSGQNYAGGLVGWNNGSVSGSHSTGKVTAGSQLGGLVGYNSRAPDDRRGQILSSYSTGIVDGNSFAGGLVGYNIGDISASFSSGAVFADYTAGGLAGLNGGSIVSSYSRGLVVGDDDTGGLVGFNHGGHIASSYSSSTILWGIRTGGLVASGEHASVSASFWDTEASRRTSSAGGTGLTTSRMQTAATFLEAGWDFVGETTNGTEDIWWIEEGRDYPRLWWELLLEVPADTPPAH